MHITLCHPELIAFHRQSHAARGTPPTIKTVLLFTMCCILIFFEHVTEVIAQEAPPNDELSVEILLTGGTVIDGTGGASRAGDVAINNGKILLPAPDQRVEAAWELDCSGPVSYTHLTLPTTPYV